VRKNIYLNLYSEYKQIIANKNINKWVDYNVTVKSEIADKINSFIGLER
jgi:hypothetical protein